MVLSSSARRPARRRTRKRPLLGPESLWSGQRDSNPRMTAWEAVALPLGDARVGPHSITAPGRRLVCSLWAPGRAEKRHAGPGRDRRSAFALVGRLRGRTGKPGDSVRADRCADASGACPRIALPPTEGRGAMTRGFDRQGRQGASAGTHGNGERCRRGRTRRAPVSRPVGGDVPCGGRLAAVGHAGRASLERVGASWCATSGAGPLSATIAPWRAAASATAPPTTRATPSWPRREPAQERTGPAPKRETRFTCNVRCPRSDGSPR